MNYLVPKQFIVPMLCTYIEYAIVNFMLILSTGGVTDTYAFSYRA